MIHVSAQNTGRAGLANKGGIVAELMINGTTRLSFLTAHLEAHEGRYKVIRISCVESGSLTRLVTLKQRRGCQHLEIFLQAPKKKSTTAV